MQANVLPNQLTVSIDHLVLDKTEKAMFLK